MREKKARIPFTCPRCGHQTARGIRIGGILSNRFRCESCGVHSTAVAYLPYSALYGIGLVAMMSLVTWALMPFLGPNGFEYAAAIAAVLVVGAVIWLSDYYWKSVLRWVETK